jgi:hypothetical protein
MIANTALYSGNRKGYAKPWEMEIDEEVVGDEERKRLR